MSRCFLLFSIMALLTSCNETGEPATVTYDQTFEVATITISGNGTSINIEAEIADTDPRRHQGLMKRPLLADGSGMLFIFDDERPRRFWMKNTIIPLDIIYFDAQGHYVSHTSMMPCKQANCKTYPSAGPAKYALELPFEYMKRAGVAGPGWRLEL